MESVRTAGEFKTFQAETDTKVLWFLWIPVTDSIRIQHCSSSGRSDQEFSVPNKQFYTLQQNCLTHWACSDHIDHYCKNTTRLLGERFRLVHVTSEELQSQWITWINRLKFIPEISAKMDCHYQKKWCDSTSGITSIRWCKWKGLWCCCICEGGITSKHRTSVYYPAILELHQLRK